MIVRYVYGTMIGESMTRDTKSAGAGAMRVVVGVSNIISNINNIISIAISISSNIRNFSIIINFSIISNVCNLTNFEHHLNIASSSRIIITKAFTKGNVLGWCLDALLPSHHLCLHRKPQGTKSPHLIRIDSKVQERHNLIAQ